MLKPTPQLLVLLAAALACTDVQPEEDTDMEATVSRPARTITRADFGDEWPFTVDSGQLRCAASAVTFTTDDGRTYGVNGMALQRGFPEIHPIWSLADDMPFDNPVTRLPERTRQTIFEAIVACEDRPATEERCKAELRARHGLTEDEMFRIGVEGVARHWLTPLRKDIGPIIRAGLALCR